MITVQSGDALAPSPCACCGRPIESCYGFLYRDAAAFAFYRAAWSYAHIDSGVDIAIDMAEGFVKIHHLPPVSFGLRAMNGADDIGITLIDGHDSAWSGDPRARRLLGREEALRHPLKGQVLDAAAQLLYDDPRIRQFLQHLADSDWNDSRSAPSRLNS